MTEEQENNRAGRRALFTGAGVSLPKVESIPVQEVAEAIRKISTAQDPVLCEIPQVFEPVISRLITLVKTINQQKTENADLESRLLIKDEQISSLQTDTIKLSADRESYLNDLITSHTEFDRALEIFQYHDVPMVLTGSERSLYDANNSFCTLFSIARSSITTAHPPLNTYFPDEPSIIGPDGEAYSIVTLTPPVVPFDHEALSLVILVKTTLTTEDETPVMEMPTEGILSEQGSEPAQASEDDPALLAFEHFPIPALVINQYRTIVACNQAFCSLVSRSKKNVYLRDIGSCGIRFADADTIAEVLQVSESREIEAVITHPDGTEETVFFGIAPVGITEEEPMVLIAGVPVNEDTNPEPVSIEIQPRGAPVDDLMLRMLLDLNPSATALLDEHARVISANDGFAEVTGINPSDLSGTDVRDLGITVPDATLIQGATEVQYLPNVIRLETTWGVQECSSMVVPVGTSGSGVTAILILQPIIHDEKTGDSPDLGKPAEDLSTPHKDIIQVPTVPQGTEDDRTTFDLDAVPIPGLITNLTGTIIRVNKAFSTMAGSGPESIEGQIKQKMMVSDPAGLVHATFPSGEFWFREAALTYPEESTEQTFWYLDITTEDKKIKALETRIKALESEVQSARNDKETYSSSHNIDAAQEIDIVEFELNEDRYAIDITMVREVVEIQPITPLPRTPAYVIGIINLRGEVTHVIDLAILLGQRPRSDRSGQKIIIIPSDVTKGEHVGIIVDNVQSVTEIMGRHVSLLGDDISAQIKTHIKGIIKITHDDILDKRIEGSQETTLIIWLDIQKILHDIQGSS